MTGLFGSVALAVGACAYLVGYAFVAPRESFLRSVPGGALVGSCVLAALAVPYVAAAVAQRLGEGAPAWFGHVWVAAAAAGLLLGMRAWRLRPGLHGGRLFAIDESPATRAAVGLQLADSLDAALDVLARERVTLRDLERLRPALLHTAARFWHQMPERQGDVYALVASHVSPEVASMVTGVLLEGAGRR